MVIFLILPISGFNHVKQIFTGEYSYFNNARDEMPKKYGVIGIRNNVFVSAGLVLVQGIIMWSKMTPFESTKVNNL